MFQDARSFGGAVTASDHKLVIAKFKLSNRYLCFRRRDKQNVHYDCPNLASNKVTQVNYQNCVNNNIQNIAVSTNPNTELENLFQSL